MKHLSLSNIRVATKRANRYAGFVPWVVPVDEGVLPPPTINPWEQQPIINNPAGAGGASGGASSQVINNNPVDDGGGSMNNPALPVMPVFPDFNAMTCEELSAAIEDMDTTLHAPSLVAKNAQWEQAMQNGIAQAQAAYAGKGCNVKNPRTDSGPTGIKDVDGSTSTIIGTTAMGQPVVATQKTTKIPWLWIGVIGGALLLTMIVGNASKD